MDIMTDQQRIDRTAEHVRGISNSSKAKILAGRSGRYPPALRQGAMDAYLGLQGPARGRHWPRPLRARRLADGGGEGHRVLLPLCEHPAILPFGTVSIGYIPDGKIVGLSKLARLVNAYARRLQVQERMTAQIADTVKRPRRGKGVIVAAPPNTLHENARVCRNSMPQQPPCTTTAYFLRRCRSLRAEFAALR